MAHVLSTPGYSLVSRDVLLVASHQREQKATLNVFAG